MGGRAKSAFRWLGIIAAFAWCATIAYDLFGQSFSQDRIAHDYSVYWRTANQAVEHAYDLRDYRPFPYAPTMLIWIAPLSAVSFLTGYVIISIASMGSLMVTCRRYMSWGATLLALTSAPVIRCIRNGQISAVLAALLIWACGTSNRIAAGVTLGVIASIKPQLVMLAPLMLVLNRDWRAFSAAGATFAATVMLSLLLFGAERWSEWAGSLGHFHDIVMSGGIVDIGVTPYAFAERHHFPPVPFLLFGTAVGCLLIYVCKDKGPLERATAIGAASLFASPYALAYDLVVIVPFAASMLWRGRLYCIAPLVTAFHPLPLLVAAYELVMQRRPVRLGAVLADDDHAVGPIPTGLSHAGPGAAGAAPASTLSARIVPGRASV